MDTYIKEYMPRYNFSKVMHGNQCQKLSVLIHESLIHALSIAKFYIQTPNVKCIEASEVIYYPIICLKKNLHTQNYLVHL